MRDLIEKISKGPVAGEGEEVEPGQCLVSIASKHGMTWERLWADPRNKSLRTARRHPNILLPGDTVAIPQREVAQIEKQIDRAYKFRQKGVTCGVQLRFTAFGMPRKFEHFEAFNVNREHRVEGRVERKGSLGKGFLDDDGMLELKIPVSDCSSVMVLVGEKKEEFIFDIGKMPPATEPRGIQMRLWNLGYYSGKFSDVFTPETEAALRRFLHKNRHESITMEYDPLTEDELKKALAYLVCAHGS